MLYTGVVWIVGITLVTLRGETGGMIKAGIPKFHLWLGHVLTCMISHPTHTETNTCENVQFFLHLTKDIIHVLE